MVRWKGTLAHERVEHRGAEPVLDGDQVAVEFPEQGAEQMRLFELDLQAGAGLGGGGGRLAAHSGLSG